MIVTPITTITTVTNLMISYIGYSLTNLPFCCIKTAFTFSSSLLLFPLSTGVSWGMRLLKGSDEVVYACLRVFVSEVFLIIKIGGKWGYGGVNLE